MLPLQERGMSEVNYWTQFYVSSNAPVDPSSFAVLVADWLSKRASRGGNQPLKVVDCGCGNGRDSRYFASLGYSVVGIDQAQSTILQNNLNRQHRDLETYVLGDFTNISAIPGDPKRCNGADVLYSRFSIHSVQKGDASRFYQWAAKDGLVNGGLFFIEARSIKDPLFFLGSPDPNGDPNASISGHYRRFIVLDELTNELKALGFDILYTTESAGLSVTPLDDPVLVRVVARLAK